MMAPQGGVCRGLRDSADSVDLYGVTLKNILSISLRDFLKIKWNVRAFIF